METNFEYDVNGSFKLKSPPAMRSCWECNSAHKHLKDVSIMHVCFVCGRYWVFGRFIDSFYKDISEEEGNKALTEHLKKHGIEPVVFD